MKTLLIIICLATLASCGTIETRYTGDQPLLEYKVATDTTINTHCIRHGDRDYVIENKKIVAQYDIDDKTGLMILAILLIFVMGLFVGYNIKL